MAGIFLVIGVCLMLGYNFVEAQDVYGLEKAQGVQGVSTSDIPEFVSTLIYWVLGLIGVILVILIVYGGYMYATSTGNETKVETAKNILTYAISGAVVVVAAFLITDYVISAIFASRGVSSGGADGGSGLPEIGEGQSSGCSSADGICGGPFGLECCSGLTCENSRCCVRRGGACGGPGSIGETACCDGLTCQEVEGQSTDECR